MMNLVFVRTNGHLLLIFSLAISLASCQHYVPLKVSPAENAERLVHRSLVSSEVREALKRNDELSDWPPKAWTPRMLVVAALALNPDLAVARAHWREAVAEIRTAAERPNPAIGAAVERKVSQDGVSPWVTSIVLDVPIEARGRRAARIAGAKALSLAAAADIDHAAWRVRSNVMHALADVATTSALLVPLQHQAALRLEIAEMLRRRLATGEVSKPEVSRASIAQMDAEVAAMRQLAACNAAVVSAAVAIGIPENNLRAVNPDLSSFESAPPPAKPPEVGTLRTLALTKRPDVLAAVDRFEAFDAAFRLEIRRQYPNLHVGPGLGWDQGDFNWVVGAALSLPIFNRNQGPIEEAKRARESAAAELLALQSKILGEVDATVKAKKFAQIRFSTVDELLKRKEELLESARKRFAAGEIDRLDLRSAELEVETARAERISALGEFIHASLDLEDAVEKPLGKE